MPFPLDPLSDSIQRQLGARRAPDGHCEPIQTATTEVRAGGDRRKFEM